MPVALPPICEQLRIAAEVDRHISNTDALAASTERELGYAIGLRQSVLRRAFEGKLVPQDPNDEPASALMDRIRHERELPATQNMGKTKITQRRRMQMAPEQERARKSIIATLREAKTPLSPEVLFRSAGYLPETVDAYYADLKAGIDTGQIEEIRTGEDGILLGIKES
jgi:type I restriction enzyme S subunit